MHSQPLCGAHSGSVPPPVYSNGSFHLWNTPSLLVLPKPSFWKELPVLGITTSSPHICSLSLLIFQTPLTITNSSLIPRSMAIPLLFLVDFHVTWCYRFLPPGLSPLPHGSLPSPPASLPSTSLSPALGPPFPLPQRPPTLGGSLVQTDSTGPDLTAWANIPGLLLTAVWPRASDVLSLCLHLFIYKAGTIMAFPGNGCWED